MSQGFCLRVKYQITGRLAFLSHLETIRSIERVVRRAGLPFAITEGFNPHMKIAFGPALPVGAGSLCEYADVRLRDYVALDTALAALQAAAPENLMPVSCEYTQMGGDAIDIAYPVSVWRCVFFADIDSQDELASAFASLLDTGYIEAEKKKGRKVTTKQIEFDGRLIDGPHIKIADDAFAPEDTGHVVVEFSTFQGSDGALRPDKFITAAIAGMDNPPAIKSLTRVALQAA